VRAAPVGHRIQLVAHRFRPAIGACHASGIEVIAAITIGAFSSPLAIVEGEAGAMPLVRQASRCARAIPERNP
jgi:hypothetical protein